MVGNDVVDLADVDADASTYSKRFDERVFTDAERAFIGASCDPGLCRWQLWAAKESAYKALKRVRPATVFSPRRFEVCVDEPSGSGQGLPRRASARVVAKGAPASSERGMAFAVEIEWNADRVHAVAYREHEIAPHFEVAMLPIASGASDVSPSAFVRRRLIRRLAAALGVGAARVRLDRRARVPVVTLDGRECDIEASLSHHGRFVACAWSPRDVRRTRPLVHGRPRTAPEVPA